MFRIYPLLILFVLVLISWQCQRDSGTAAATASDKVFFDLRAFFEEEIARLEKEKPRIAKAIEINGQLEQQTQEGVDFAKELAIFVRSDINKPAWRDKYTVDSTIVARRLAQLEYIAIDSSLKTRLMRIDFDQTGVEKIFISNRTDSPLIKSAQQLTFEPAKGYQIENQQDLSLSKDSKLSISAQFLR